MYLERIKYGRYVAKSNGTTLDGSYYMFPNKTGGFSIGGPRNYRRLNFLEYAILYIIYFLLKNVFKGTYKDMVNASWID